MPANGSVTYWIERARSGDQTAARKLWERYYEDLVRRARQQLGRMPRRIEDEEDVVVSALDSFYRGMKAGRYPDVHDRHDLWRLLLAITTHKAVDTIRRETREKRGGGRVVNEGAGQNDSDDPMRSRLLEVVDREPTPELAAIFAENFQRRLAQLGDDTLRQVALRKLEGYQNDEIASELGCASRTVERKLHLIRRVWTD